MISMQIDRELIAKQLGITKCEHCLKLCPYCPRLLAVRPDLRPEPQESSHPDPGVFQKAVNLGKAIVEHAGAGFPATDTATVDNRWAICRTCEHFNTERTACNVCGCHLDIKITWAEQKCPIGKW